MPDKSSRITRAATANQRRPNVYYLIPERVLSKRDGKLCMVGAGDKWSESVVKKLLDKRLDEKSKAKAVMDVAAEKIGGDISGVDGDVLKRLLQIADTLPRGQQHRGKILVRAIASHVGLDASNRIVYKTGSGAIGGAAYDLLNYFTSKKGPFATTHRPADAEEFLTLTQKHAVPAAAIARVAEPATPRVAIWTSRLAVDSK